MRRIPLAGAMLAAISAVASAGDLSYPVSTMGAGPMVAPSFNWVGTYIGVNGGFGSGSLDWAYAPPPGTANHSTSGGLLGVALGVNMTNGSWLYGLEGDADWANINGSTACPNPVFTCASKLQWLGTLRGRLGWTTNNILIYGTGGLAAGGVNISTTRPGFAVPPSGTATNGSTSTDLGWTAGLGAEFGFYNNWSLKAEWLYYDLGTHRHTVDQGLVVNARETGNIFKVGLNNHF